MHCRALFAVAVASASFAIFGVAAGCSYDWTFVEESGDGSKPNPESPEEGTEAAPVECKRDGKECTPPSFCRFEDGHCGQDGFKTVGICVTPDQFCRKPPETPSTCTCDGRVVGSACEAGDLGVDLDADELACPKAGTFKCIGTSGCKAKVEYCLLKKSAPGLGQCVPVTTCAPPISCACPDLPTVECSCSGLPEEGVTVECSG